MLTILAIETGEPWHFACSLRRGPASLVVEACPFFEVSE
jgi:hypothetical protein